MPPRYKSRGVLQLLRWSVSVVSQKPETLMATRNILVDFYELVLPPDAQPFASMLGAFMQTFGFAQRNKVLSGKIMRVSEAHFGQVVEGDFTKVLMDNLPDK